MVRIGVYKGSTKKRGLTLYNFTVLNELEYTKVTLNSFSLVGRYNEFAERLVENRIYLVNIKDEPSKPVKHYEILDKCKLIKYVDGEYLITYKRYRNQSLIDLLENRYDEAKGFIDWVLQHGKKSDKVKLNTFSKTVLEKLFENYGYEDLIRYDSKNEKSNWNKSITEKVKNFNRKIDDKSTNWSKDEEQFLSLNMDVMSEKELAKHLGRTVPSIATKKWKIKHEYKSKLKDMKDRADKIAEKLKNFREDHGWSQRQLVDESGISLSVINQLECKNYTSTTSPTVMKLLKFVDDYDKEFGTEPVEQPLNGDVDVIKDTKEVETPSTPKSEVESLKVGEHYEHITSKLDNIAEQLVRLNINIERTLVDKAGLEVKSNKLQKELVLRQLADMLTT